MKRFSFNNHEVFFYLSYLAVRHLFPYPFNQTLSTLLNYDYLVTKYHFLRQINALMKGQVRRETFVGDSTSNYLSMEKQPKTAHQVHFTPYFSFFLIQACLAIQQALILTISNNSVTAIMIANVLIPFTLKVISNEFPQSAINPNSKSEDDLNLLLNLFLYVSSQQSVENYQEFPMLYQQLLCFHHSHHQTILYSVFCLTSIDTLMPAILSFCLSLFTLKKP